MLLRASRSMGLYRVVSNGSCGKRVCLVEILQTARADEFVALVRQRLREKTARHSISTAETMVPLADECGFTVEQAVTAGVLHDLAKDMKGPRLLDAARDYGFDVTDVQRANPKLLHGPVAAEEVLRTLDVDDEAVYEAIYWHTTGRPGLGGLGLALYYADFSELCRQHAEAEQARAVMETGGFTAALRYVATRKLEYVLTKPSVDPMTPAFHTWLHEEYV